MTVSLMGFRLEGDDDGVIVVGNDAMVSVDFCLVLRSCAAAVLSSHVGLGGWEARPRIPPNRPPRHIRLAFTVLCTSAPR